MTSSRSAIYVLVIASALWLSSVVDVRADDADGDGIDNVWDDCINVENGLERPRPTGSPQADTDVDGYGNHCDCDFDNNGMCGYGDFNLFLQDFGGAGSKRGTDMDDDGIVGYQDFSLFMEGFGETLTTQGSPPSITSISPENATPGAEITITGERFSSNLSENTVYFNEVSAEILEASATELVVEVPMGVDLGFVWIRASVTIQGIEFPSMMIELPSSNRRLFLVENIPAADFRNVVVSGDSSIIFNAELFESYTEGNNYNMLLISNLVNFASNAPEKILLDFSRTSASKRIDDWKIGNNWPGPCGGSYDFGTDHTKLSGEERRYFSDYLGNCLGFEVEINPPGGSALNLLYPDGLDEFKVVFIIAPVSHYSVDERLLLRQWSGQFGRRLIIMGEWKEYWAGFPDECNSAQGFPPGRVNSLLSDLFSCKSPTYPPQLNNDDRFFVSGADCDESVCSLPYQFSLADTYNVIPGVTEGFPYCHWVTVTSCYNLVLNILYEDVALVDLVREYPVLTASYVPRCPDDLQIGIIFDVNVSRPVRRDPPAPISVDNSTITVCAKHTVQGLDLGTANPNINGVPATSGDPFNRFFCADIPVMSAGVSDVVAELTPPGAPTLQDTIQVRMDDENIHLDHYVMNGRITTDPPVYTNAIERGHLTDEKNEAGVSWDAACTPLGLPISKEIHEFTDALKTSRNAGLYELKLEHLGLGNWTPYLEEEVLKLLEYRDTSPAVENKAITLFVVRRFVDQDGAPIDPVTQLAGFANTYNDSDGDFVVIQAPLYSIAGTTVPPAANVLAHEIAHDLTHRKDNCAPYTLPFPSCSPFGDGFLDGPPPRGTDLRSENPWNNPPQTSALTNCLTAVEETEVY